MASYGVADGVRSAEDLGLFSLSFPSCEGSLSGGGVGGEVGRIVIAGAVRVGGVVDIVGRV